MDEMEVICDVKEEIIDEEDLCRLCAEKSFMYCSILQENLHESLSQNFGLSINPADNWPKAVCRKCMETAKICLDFLSIARKAETTFQTIYGDAVDPLLPKHDIEIIDMKELSKDSQSNEDIFHDENPEISPNFAVKEEAEDDDDAEVVKFTTVLTKSIEEQMEHNQGESNDVVADDMMTLSPEVKEEQEDKPIEENSGNLEAKETFISLQPTPRVMTVRDPKEIEEENRKLRAFYDMRCPNCKEPFDDLLVLIKHYKKVHRHPGFFKCHCGRKIKNRTTLVTHMNEHINPKAHKCPHCDKGYTSKSSLKYHISTHNKPKPVEEDKKGSDEDAETDKEEEDAKLREFYELKCFICEESFEKFPQLFNHCQKVHQAKAFIECCEKNYYSRACLLNHMNYHIYPDGFKCPECTRSFHKRKSLRSHMLNQHTPKDQRKYKCPDCDKTFMTSTAFNLHSRKHYDWQKRGFACKFCQVRRTFESPILLQKHIRHYHSEESIEKFVCDTCGREFRTRTSFKKHMAFHLTTESCPICKKKFNSKNWLDRHYKKHFEDKPTYLCDICGKVSASYDSQRAHLKVHLRRERKMREKENSQKENAQKENYQKAEEHENQSEELPK
ncbi:zinc finger protein weckle-like [Lutzomyia longipalpis]|uniref:zinc finger protein weckle-like n=1 Tax=Lutzomyia longipalpis TaxID=7200 RepID=UPI002483798A|nr:zinc finger protein weckle-like [Lutzomyia longipalpis]